MRNASRLAGLAAACTATAIAVLAAPCVLAGPDQAAVAAAVSIAPHPTSTGVQPGGPAAGGTGPFGRLVQSGSATSGNWSGLALSAGKGYFTSVYGGWTEPAVTCGLTNQYAAFWVGLDGWPVGSGNNTVEQTGTLAECLFGSPVYRAWYEMYPDPIVYIGGTVAPGDTLTGSVTYSGGSSYTLTLADPARGWSSTIHASRAGAWRASAEAIAEAPTVDGSTAPLADFGTANFGIPVINGHKITSYSPTIITMIDSSGLDLDTITVTELGNFSATWRRST